MKRAAKKASKKVSKKMRVKTENKVISLAIAASGDKIVKTGDVDANGNIVVDQSANAKITFNYDDNAGNKTFALFIIRFTPDPGQGGGPHETPFNARVYITDDGEIGKNVKASAKKGRYEYRLALLDSNGNLVTEDPQIIVQ
jgi:hypothetical protein